MMTKKLSMSTILLAALLPFGANAAEAVSYTNLTLPTIDPA